MAATYNCNDSSNSAYGASAYGTCAAQTQSVGAPNTGTFQQLVSSGSFSIIAPLAAAIIIVIIATVITKRRKKSAN